MRRIFHDNDSVVFGVMCSLLSKKQLIEKHLLSSLTVAERNVWGGCKIFTCAIRLPTPQLWIIAILTNVGYIFLCCPMKSKLGSPLIFRK